MSFFSKSLNFFKGIFREDTWDAAEAFEAFKIIDIFNHIEHLKKKYAQHILDHIETLVEIFYKHIEIEYDGLNLERKYNGENYLKSPHMKKMSEEKKQAFIDQFNMNTDTLIAKIPHRHKLEFNEIIELYRNEFDEMESILFKKENLISFFELYYPESHCRDELEEKLKNADNYKKFCDKVTSKFIENSELVLLEKMKEMNKKIEEFHNKFGK